MSRTSHAKHRNKQMHRVTGDRVRELKNLRKRVAELARESDHDRDTLRRLTMTLCDCECCVLNEEIMRERAAWLFDSEAVS